MREGRSVAGQAIGSWLFSGDFVKRVGHPGVFRIVKIVWDEERTIVADASGKLLPLDWDEIEFLDDEAFFL